MSTTTTAAPRPTGCVRKGPLGYDLELTRTFRATIEDVWTSVTASESTARWIGSWSGDAAPGKTITLTMLFETGEPTSQITIDACEPPSRVALTSNDASGAWTVEMRLTQTGDTTTLVFSQQLSDPALAGDMGPGWEYYLDKLVSSRTGEPALSFEAYYPAQKSYYLTTALRE